MIRRVFNNLTNGKVYTFRIFPYRILPNGQKLFQTDIQGAYSTSSPVDQIPLSVLEVGDRIRDRASGNDRHFIIADVNHAGYPTPSYQLLTEDRFTVNFSKNGYNLDSIYNSFSSQLKGVLMDMPYRTLFETVVRKETNGANETTSSYSVTTGASKIILPSIYEIGHVHVGQKDVPMDKVDGEIFELFYASFNREYPVSWVTRSVFVDETSYNLSGKVISHRFAIPRIGTDGDKKVVAIQYDTESINLAVRCIVSVPPSITLYASPDLDGVYNIMWPEF